MLDSMVKNALRSKCKPVASWTEESIEQGTAKLQEGPWPRLEEGIAECRHTPWATQWSSALGQLMLSAWTNQIYLSKEEGKKEGNRKKGKVGRKKKSGIRDLLCQAKCPAILHPLLHIILQPFDLEHIAFLLWKWN